MHHHHVGESDHNSHPAEESSRGSRRLAWALLVTAVYLVAEVLGGLWTNSLALLADAGHMLTDVASLALAMMAIWLSRQPAPAYRTFGYHRAEILAALVNGAALLAACLWIAYEAIGRFRSPPEVLGAGMFAVACGGLVVNLIAARILHGSREESLNIRSAWLHVLADLLGSVAAIIGGLLVWLWGWFWIDPAISLVIALLVLYSAWHLLAEATGVLMESVPRGIDVDEVRAAIGRTEGVASQHDLHVWSITPGRVCLSVHVVAAPFAARDEVLGRLQRMLRTEFGISHTTIQVESEGYEECELGDCEASERESGGVGDGGRG